MPSYACLRSEQETKKCVKVLQIMVSYCIEPYQESYRMLNMNLTLSSVIGMSLCTSTLPSLGWHLTAKSHWLWFKIIFLKFCLSSLVFSRLDFDILCTVVTDSATLNCSCEDLLAEKSN